MKVGFALGSACSVQTLASVSIGGSWWSLVLRVLAHWDELGVDHPGWGGWWSAYFCLGVDWWGGGGGGLNHPHKHFVCWYGWLAPIFRMVGV